VDGEERLRGTVSGGYDLVGRYDGEAFTVTEVGPFDEALRPLKRRTPTYRAPAPGVRAAGLRSTTRKRTTTGFTPTPACSPTTSRRGRPTFEPDRLEFSPVLVNAVFTGDSERHEAELRKLWDGPLCVVERDVPTERAVSRIRREVEAGLDELGLQMLWSSRPDVHLVVEIGVVAGPGGEAQATLDQRDGAGLVRLYPALKEVS
jgi:hypothetical protein